MEKTQNPVVVMGAIQSETDLLLASLDNRKDTSLGGFEAAEGTIDGFPVVIVRTGIGMVHAAAAAALAIERYHPCRLLMAGTAGAHDPALHRGDIVLAEHTVNLGAYASDPLPAGAGIHPTAWKPRPTEVFTDESLFSATELGSDEAMLRMAEDVPYADGRVVRGTIGSADQWNREADRIADYHTRFGTACEEMEGFAVAQIAAERHVPMLLLRVISNSEMHPDEVMFDKTTAQHCQTFVLSLLHRLLHEI